MNHLHGQASCSSCIQTVDLFPTTIWVVLVVAIVVTLTWVGISHLGSR